MRALQLFCYLSACLATLPAFYHSSEEVRRLVSSWEDEDLQVLPTQAVDAVLITASPSPRTFVVCGEHPRELISVETCLELIRKAKDRDVGTLLVVFNANPDAREKVEGGDSCLRTNLNGVDINRNWDTFWKPADCSIQPETCPGEKPMTEPQVLEERDLMASANPDIMVTIHSGSSKILTPYAYDQVGAPADIGPMMNLLQRVSHGSPVGPAAEMLEYDCPGTLLDYAYVNTDATVAVAFEIYQGEEQLKSFLGDKSCFSRFNPANSEEYESSIQSWSDKVLELIKLVRENA